MRRPVADMVDADRQFLHAGRHFRRCRTLCFRGIGHQFRRIRHRFRRLRDLGRRPSHGLEVALQAFKQAVQGRAHLADLVVAPNVDARRQVEFRLDARDGLLHATESAADAAVQGEAETAHQQHAERKGNDGKKIALGERGVRDLALHRGELPRMLGMLGKTLFQRVGRRLGLGEEFLGVGVLALARLLEHRLDRSQVGRECLAIRRQQLAVTIVAIGRQFFIVIERRREHLLELGDALVVAFLLVVVPGRHVSENRDADFEKGPAHQADGLDRRHRVPLAVFDGGTDRVRDPIADDADDQQDRQRQ